MFFNQLLTQIVSFDAAFQVDDTDFSFTERLSLSEAKMGPQANLEKI